MEVAVQNRERFPAHPLDDLQLTRLQQAIEGLNSEQLVWASGYLAALAAYQPKLKQAANESPALTLLYATQSGNARSVAEQLADRLQASGYAPRLVSAENYRPRDLAKEKLLIVVISTQGEGDPPESATGLFSYLQSKKTASLSDLHYAIFGLGDSSYDRYCQAAKTLERLFDDHGAKRLIDRVDADVDFEADAESWQQQIHAAVTQHQPEVQALVIPLQRSAQLRYDRNNPYQAELIERRRITTDDALSEVHHLSFEIDPQLIQFQPGDALGLYFRNDPAMIEELLSITGLSGEVKVTLGSDEMTLNQALVERLELTQLHPSVVRAWSALADDQRLRDLSENIEQLREFVSDRQLIDLVASFPAEVDEQSLVKLLHHQQSRLYSIASSQRAIEDEIHLTVSTLQYRSHSRNHLGGASGDLTRRVEATNRVGVYVVENPSFRLPVSPDTPMIMVGSGTGIAPYRAFLQQQESLGTHGRNWLVFGNRHFHQDFLYQTDWLNYRKSGLLERISLAFSRDNQERTYVQARLYEEGAELYHWLQEGAHLYVCGGIEMERGIYHSLLAVAQTHGGHDEASAADYIESLRTQGRYQRDVY
ncbi:MAG: flavodoxin domain-containing protein [Candidatus Thiodiazotropha weberae]|nr:flavodoxin domain-containing protein [Candidatus Thiodiazotropha lotti]MCG8011793.1 flavodoxin domain-containing protein [Candidatus Thiodiazotropha lotti]MCG8021062.1 flavodoxin domain-containing protein [Candidatus Thiodiazotropha lotti]MCW4208228.1 flavodoxin domain-containing protein [Candidatus Thiodiazotropha lotti]MCW4211259.1 flavodoxin domain-containing protein [Candidatus Thiodiazotropha lotti]